jgi:lambda repressor-like predicted transcriptional regulator
MWTRCTREIGERWQDYGARGITVCERWQTFDAFVVDMGNRPDGLSLDRIDNNKGYEPGNCRWATKKEQARNSRKNRLVPFQDQVMTLSEVCERTGLPYDTLRSRLDRGWPVERAITAPLGARRA